MVNHLNRLYSRLYKMMNELVRNKCDVTDHQMNVQFLLQLQPEWGKVCRTHVKLSQERRQSPSHIFIDILKQTQNKSQQSTRNRGKAIVTSSAPTYNPELATVTEDVEMSKEKEIDKLMDLISLSYDNQRAVNGVWACINGNVEPKNEGKGCRRITGKDFIVKTKRKVGVQLNAEQADWKDDTDDESDDQELEAHYIYMAQI
ncbi:hypothetical protein Tco_0269267 [Tanacetum coccineum]